MSVVGRHCASTTRACKARRAEVERPLTGFALTHSFLFDRRNGCVMKLSTLQFLVLCAANVSPVSCCLSSEDDMLDGQRARMPPSDVGEGDLAAAEIKRRMTHRSGGDHGFAYVSPPIIRQQMLQSQSLPALPGQPQGERAFPKDARSRNEVLKAYGGVGISNQQRRKSKRGSSPQRSGQQHHHHATQLADMITSYRKG